MMGRSEILVILNGLIGCEPSEVANILYSIIPEGGRERDEVERNVMNTYLDDLVPPAGDNDGVHDVGTEAHARYPVRNAFTIHAQAHTNISTALTTQCGRHP